MTLSRGYRGIIHTQASIIPASQFITKAVLWFHSFQIGLDTSLNPFHVVQVQESARGTMSSWNSCKGQLGQYEKLCMEKDALHCQPVIPSCHLSPLVPLCWQSCKTQASGHHMLFPRDLNKVVQHSIDPALANLFCRGTKPIDTG